ncbi:hypothetical protein GCM10020258_24280 [Sphingomonas yabuuchiae]
MLAPSLLGRIEGTVVSDGTRSIALTRAITSPGEARLRAIVPTDAPSAMQRIVAGSVTQTLTPDTAIGFGFASTGDAMVSGWTGQSGPAYLMTDPGAGMDRAPRAAAALHHVMGRVGVSVAAENGRFAAPMPGMAAPGYDQMTMTFDRRLGPIAATLGVTRLDEQSTVLGGWFGGALGQARGRSWFADGAARWQDDGGWTLGARWRSGWTRAIGGLGGGMLASRAWSVEAGKAGLFGHDRIDLRLSRPLRVSGGGWTCGCPATGIMPAGRSMAGRATVFRWPHGAGNAGRAAPWHPAGRGRVVDASVLAARPRQHHDAAARAGHGGEVWLDLLIRGLGWRGRRIVPIFLI